MNASDEIIAILSDLISIPSQYPLDSTTKICIYACTRLQKAGYETEILS